MEMLSRYLDYRKHKPDYQDWKAKREEAEAKKLAYIEKNGISEAQKQEDIKRAKAVLNAVDVMDEYSQSRAEDMEMFVQGVTQQIAPLMICPGMGLGALLGYLLSAKKGLPKKKQYFWD